MDCEKLVSLALTIGERLLCSGAEVSRVEDSISRICKAYGAEHVDVFTITSSIVLTVCIDNKIITQTRRIKRHKTDFELFDKLNNLSREICDNKPDAAYISEQLKILEKNNKNNFIKYVAWFIVAGSFTMFFGGTLNDALFSSIIAIIARFIFAIIESVNLNRVFTNIVLSFTVSSLAYNIALTGLNCNSDKIIIGNIMLLIPGIALTNAIRDLIVGDTMTGLLNISEALLTAIAIS